MRHTLLLALLVLAPAVHAERASPREQARAAAAAKVYAAVDAQYRLGTEPLDAVYLWSLRWSEAARASGQKGAAQEHLARMQALESAVKAKADSGMARPVDALAAEFYRVEAEALAARK